MYKKIAVTILLIATIFLSGAEFVYWWSNPKLTTMQVFLEYWLYNIILILLCIGVSLDYPLDKNDKKWLKKGG